MMSPMSKADGESDNRKLDCVDRTPTSSLADDLDQEVHVENGQDFFPALHHRSYRYPPGVKLICRVLLLTKPFR